MTTMKTASLLLAGLIAAGASGLASAADVLPGFSGWTAAGDVVIQGDTAATLSTAAIESGETPLGTSSALLFDELEPALGLTAGALPGDTYEGSGLTLQLNLTGPVRISFDWSFSTASFDAGYLDRGFVAVDGLLVSQLGEAAVSPVGGRFSLTLDAGARSFAFGILDVNSTDLVSSLSISNLTVTAVPEPATYGLMLAGLAGVGALARRRSQRSAAAC